MAAEAKEEFDIFLDYEREGTLSSGNIIVRLDNSTQSSEGFQRVEFRYLLGLLARTVAKTSIARVVLRRTDCPALFPYVLDQVTIGLFRTDPVAAINSMMFETPEVPVTRSTLREAKPVEVRPVRVGYDTLSDSFGELVYVRTRDSSIECPVCGLWGEAAVDRSGRGFFTCARRCKDYYQPAPIPITLSRLWAGVAVEYLLAIPVKRYFLPRLWNSGNVWISRDDLHAKYKAYKAEKEAACNLVATTV